MESINLETRVNWDKLDDESMKFLSDQAMRALDETVKGYRETKNKSFAILGIYLSILLICLKGLISSIPHSFYSDIYIVACIGLLLCCTLLFYTLFSPKIHLSGLQPDFFLKDHSKVYENQTGKAQHHLFLKTLIITHNKEVYKNEKTIATVLKMMRWSYVALLLTFIGVIVSALY